MIEKQWSGQDKIRCWCRLCQRGVERDNCRRRDWWGWWGPKCWIMCSCSNNWGPSTKWILWLFGNRYLHCRWWRGPCQQPCSLRGWWQRYLCLPQTERICHDDDRKVSHQFGSILIGQMAKKKYIYIKLMRPTQRLRLNHWIYSYYRINAFFQCITCCMPVFNSQ